MGLQARIGQNRVEGQNGVEGQNRIESQNRIGGQNRQQIDYLPGTKSPYQGVRISQWNILGNLANFIPLVSASHDLPRVECTMPNTQVNSGGRSNPWTSKRPQYFFHGVVPYINIHRTPPTSTPPAMADSRNMMASMAIPKPRAPTDLSHHFNKMSRERTGNEMKILYKYFQAPEITNLAGGVYCAVFP